MGMIGSLFRSLQFRIRDESGRERRLAFPNGFRLRRQGVPRAIRMHFRILSWRVMLGCVVCSIFLGLIQWLPNHLWWSRVLEPWSLAARTDPVNAGAPPSITPVLVAQLVTLVIAASAMLALTPLMIRGMRRRYRCEMLRIGRCPWCVYDLRGSRASHHVTVCAECGGSWRVGEGEG